MKLLFNPTVVKLPIISYDVLGALRESLPNYNEAFIVDAIERYKRFLALAKLYPNEKLVPTKDIDIVWHDHMLHPRIYVKDCTDYLGYILDHKPSTKGEDLTEFFRKTVDIWAEVYNENYSKNFVAGVCDSGSCGSNCSD